MKKPSKLASNAPLMLDVKNLEVVFPQRRGYFVAVKDASFAIKKGEILGLVGESGSGKSTIGKALITVNNFSAGSITIDGFELPNDAANLSRKDRQFITRHVQYIFQNPFGALTPRKKIRRAIIDAYRNNYKYRDYVRAEFTRYLSPLLTEAVFAHVLSRPLTTSEQDRLAQYRSAERELTQASAKFYIGQDRAYIKKRNAIINLRKLQTQKKLTDKEYLAKVRAARATLRDELRALRTKQPLFVRPPLIILAREWWRGLEERNFTYRAVRFARKHSTFDLAAWTKWLHTFNKKADFSAPLAALVKQPYPTIKTRQQQEKEMLTDISALASLTPELLEKRPNEMSGGQQQRAVIARALAVKPRLLVADEPVAALDVSIQSQVINTLKDLRAKLGISILFIAHDLNVVRNISDRVIVMLYGELLEEGTAEEIFAHPLHPYTKALLKSIPDVLEFNIERANVAYDFIRDGERAWHTLTPTHKVYATPQEFKQWQGAK